MLASRLRGLTFAATLAVVIAPPAMPWVMAACAAESGASVHHGHHGPATPHRMAATDCCDACLSTCGAMLDVPRVADPVTPATSTLMVRAAAAVGLPFTFLAQHRLPFPAGPPTLRSA